MSTPVAPVASFAGPFSPQVRLAPAPETPTAPVSRPGFSRRDAGGDPLRRSKIGSIRSAAAKQKVVLHDVDKGLPCLECEECPGFEVHFWRKVCVHCRCSRESHDVELRPEIQKRRWVKVGLAVAATHHTRFGKTSETVVVEEDESEGMHQTATFAVSAAATGTASGHSRRDGGGSDIVDVAPPPMAASAALSNSAAHETPDSVVDVMLTVEERTAARKQLAAAAHQDPVHDHLLVACVAVKPENRAAFEKLNADRAHDCHLATEAGTPLTEQCGTCRVAFVLGDNIVTAHAVNTTFHKACFQCASCAQRLATLHYYAHKGAVYCGRCQAEKYLPRCNGCQELIFDKEYTVAEKAKWHKEHFCCYDCDVNICDVRYSKGSHGQSCCLPCYNAVHASACGTCRALVEAGQTAVKIGATAFHKTPACFHCHMCRANLEGQPCAVAPGTTTLLCAADYRKMHVQPCGKCREDVSGKFIDAMGVRFHVHCFSCAKCNAVFETSGDKGAFPVNGKLFCYVHALEQKLQSGTSSPVVVRKK